MNPQTSEARLRDVDAARKPIDALGDLFFSSGGAAGRDAPPSGPRDGNRASINDLIARPAPPPEVRAVPPLVAVLGGGLPPDRRAAMARAAARRLVTGEGLTLVVTLRNERACIEAVASSPERVAEAAALADHETLARRFARLAADARVVALVLPDGAEPYLCAGRCLPDHCVVLATPDAESLVEAYRELKLATSSTAGFVPDVFVMDSRSEASAERTYRRLARVAISHLGGTPTFAGQSLGRAEDCCARSGSTSTVVMDYVEAAMLYDWLRPMLDAIRPRTADVDPPPAPSPSPAVATDAEDSADPCEPDSADEFELPFAAEDFAQADPPPAEEPAAFPSPAGLRHTVPPLAGIVPSPRGARLFSAWSPASSEETIAAVRDSLDGLLPGCRGLLDIDGDLRVEELPDLVAVDAAGRPAAILIADDAGARLLRRAVDARCWLDTYLRLLARAYPQAGLDPAAGAAPTVVLAPEHTAAELEALCPPGVALVAYRGVRFARVSGLIYQQILRAVEPAIAPSGAAALFSDVLDDRMDPLADELPGEADPISLDPPAEAPAARVTSAPPAAAAPRVEPEPEPEPVGTSADDDLSADELSDLKSSFEIDELT